MSRTEDLSNLIIEAERIFSSKPGNSDFENWHFKCQHILEKWYGKDSSVLKRFIDLPFCDPFGYLGGSTSVENRRYFQTSYEEALGLFNMLKEESGYSHDDEKDTVINKIFISHSSKDVRVVEEFVDLLENIGLDSNNIFCSSLDGYGIPLGENFIKRLKSELSAVNSMVVFILSDNFYKSPVCMCEMGATWIQSKEHVPVLIPPFSFEEIDGTLKLTQGFMINDSMKWNEFKDKIIQTFGLEDLSDSVWERKRDRTIGRINEILGDEK